MAVAIACLAACGDTLDPRTTGAEQLATIEGLRCEGTQPLLFSPSGQWLLFSRHDPTQGETLPHEQLGLFDLDSARITWLQPEPAARALQNTGRHPRTERACWSGNVMVHFPVNPRAYPQAGIEATGGIGFRVRLSQPQRLETAEVPSDCASAAATQWRFESPDRARIAPDLRVSATPIDGPASIELRMPDGQILAQHKARSAAADQIVLAAYTWSPGGVRLAYLLAESMGSFGRPNRGWQLRPGDTEPTELATGLYSLQWQDDDTLFACGRIGGQRELSIVRWRFESGAAHDRG